MGWSGQNPRRSTIKRKRQVGFRRWMKTKKGRRMLNRRRRMGRKLSNL